MSHTGNISDYPEYPKLYWLLLKIGCAMAGKIKRSFQEDARDACKKIVPPLLIKGQENLLMNDSLSLITVNHYSRQGFGAWWIALVISAAASKDIHWIITSAWTFQDKWYGLIGKIITRKLFHKLAEVYDFTNMPPMPPSPVELWERAVAIKKIIKGIHTDQIVLLGIAPEGRDHPNSILSPTPPGVGRFIQFLSNIGFEIVPIGIFEESGFLQLNIGKKYSIKHNLNTCKKDGDSILSNIVMNNIAVLLPPHLRGCYGN